MVTSEKKTTRPTTLNRKSTPQYITKSSGPSLNTRREREQRERDDDDRSRDSGESFPQYCMSCEKQFLPANDTYLYCSDSCRIHDQAPTPTSATRTHSYPSFTPTTPHTPYTRAFASYSGSLHEEGPDIIPRFSPTQSRPRSYFNSDPYPQTYKEPSHISSSVPHHQYASSRSSTALASLRELATALPKTNGNSSGRPESPPTSMNRPTSGVWNYIPFAGSKTATPTPSGTPGNSYTNTQNPYTVSQSYSAQMSNGYGRSKEDLYAYGKSQGGTYYGNPGMGMDRPLPPRSGHRPRSVDLVTPFPEH